MRARFELARQGRGEGVVFCCAVGQGRPRFRFRLGRKLYLISYLLSLIFYLKVGAVIDRPLQPTRRCSPTGKPHGRAMLAPTTWVAGFSDKNAAAGEGLHFGICTAGQGRPRFRFRLGRKLYLISCLLSLIFYLKVGAVIDRPPQPTRRCSPTGKPHGRAMLAPTT